MRFFIWPLLMPQVLVWLGFSLFGFALLMVLKHGSEHMFELSLLFFLPMLYGLFGGLALTGQLRLNDVARGVFVESGFGHTNVNPFQSAVALKLAGVFGALLLILLFAPGELWLLVLAGLVYPVLYLSVALEQSLSGVFRPELGWHLVRRLSFLYPLLALVLSGSAGLLAWVMLYDTQFLYLAGSAWLFLFAHQLCGLMLYSRRGALELNTVDSPEQRRASQALQQAAEIDSLLVDLQRLCNSGSVHRAYVKLDIFLAGQDYALDSQMHERLRIFHDSRLFLEHGVHYLQRVVERRDLRKAWTLLKDCLDVEERFRPAEAAVLLELTKVAERQDALLVESLLSDFADAYPDSDLIAEAMLRRARVQIELLGEGASGLRILDTITRQFPEFAAGEAFQRYRSRLRLKRDG